MSNKQEVDNRELTNRLERINNFRADLRKEIDYKIILICSVLVGVVLGAKDSLASLEYNIKLMIFVFSCFLFFNVFVILFDLAISVKNLENQFLESIADEKAQDLKKKY